MVIVCRIFSSTFKIAIAQRKMFDQVSSRSSLMDEIIHGNIYTLDRNRWYLMQNIVLILDYIT